METDDVIGSADPDSFRRDAGEDIGNHRAVIATLLRATWLARKDVFSLLCSIGIAGTLALGYGDLDGDSQGKNWLRFGIAAWVRRPSFAL